MPKAGAYFLYMVDFKKEKEHELGRSLSMAEVSKMASDSWNSMSDDDKAYYKEKAKGGEVRIPKRPGGSASGGSGGGSRMTSQGVPVEAYERDERERKRAEEKMRLRVASLIQSVPLMTDFLSHPLYLMYGNYFYKNEKTDEYSPAEVTMVKFTFRDGILKRFHTFVCPDKPALGYAFTAKSHSETTHRLPVPPDAFGEKNLRRVWCDMEKFIGTDIKDFDGGKLMVFTFADAYSSEANQIEVLKSFMKQFVGSDSLPIDLYPLTRLFYMLRKELAARHLVDAVPNERYCDMFLTNDPYETIGGISCDYHEGIDATRYCAQSRCVRWTYLLADHFCEHLGVELIRGMHLPKNADVNDSLLFMKSGSEDEVSVKDEKIQSDSDIVSKFEDCSLNVKPAAETRASNSTIHYETQSVRTSSTASEAASSGERKKTRHPRTALIASSIHNQPNSSTFYNA